MTTQPSLPIQIDCLFDAHWRSIDQLGANAAEFPHWSPPWLTHRDSLTERLEHISQHTVSVQVLDQHIGPIPKNARLALQATAAEPPSQALHRAVFLSIQHQPVVFAYSIIPEPVFRGRYSALKTLGNQPLGHWLFKEPALRRQPMSIRRLSLASLGLTNWLPKQRPEHQLVGRRSFFTGAASPLCVCEFFFDDTPWLSGRQPNATPSDKTA